MKKLALHWKIIIAMVLGMVWALISGQLGLNKFTIDWIDPFGTIFINCLKFIAVPLVLFSIITGVAGLGSPSELGKMGFKTLGLYLVTTVAAVSIGLFVVNVFKPGRITDVKQRTENRLEYELWARQSNIPTINGKNVLATADSIMIKAVQQKMDADTLSKDYSELETKNSNAQKTKSAGPLQPLVDMVPSNIIQAMSDGTLMLQVIFFALFFGISMSLLPSGKTETIRGFFDGMNEVFIKMVNIIMMAAPFFVFCLMSGVLAKKAGSPGELITILGDLGYYSLIVLLGLSIMLFLFYPMMLKLFGVKIKVKDFYKGLSPAQVLAFSTSSSAATLPVTIQCVEENLKIPKKVSDFVLPIGATVNMDGTSLYQAVAVVFLAQYHDIDLSLMQQLGIVGTATLASIGAAAVPGAGLIMLMIVLTSVGLNPLWVAFVLPVDRLLDMCRTVVNVTSDATVASIIAKSEED
jgi:Na+/H+-dicarboxylate symporter